MTPSQRIEEGARLCKMALARMLWGDELYCKARPDWPLLDP